MTSAFITQIKTDATDVEQDVVSGLKAGLNYVDNVYTTDIEPNLVPDLIKALETVGSAILSSILSQVGFGATISVPAAPTSTATPATPAGS